MKDFEKRSTRDLLLLTLDYFLRNGVNKVLKDLSKDVTKEDLHDYPYVEHAMRKKGLLKEGN